MIYSLVSVMSQSNPYQVNVPLDTRVEGNHPQGYNPLRGLERFLTVGLKIYIGMALVLTVAHIMYQIVGSRILDGQTTFTGSLEDEELLQDSIQALLAIPTMLLYWGLIIASIRWIMRAQKNLPVLGARGMTITPGWAAGWFFIPIANYWKPYEAMKQLWQASATAKAGSPGSTWKTAPVPPFMVGWWTLWVITNIAASISFRLGMRANTFEDYLFIGYLDVILAPLEAFVGLQYLKIIKGITNNQEAASASAADRTSSFDTSASPDDGQGSIKGTGPEESVPESRFPSGDSSRLDSRFPSQTDSDPYA